MRFALPTLVLLAVVSPVPADDATKLSARVDELLSAKWKGKVEPAPDASDSEFFRRLSLDLTGRVPSLSAARDFLEDSRPNKRRQWADEFLDGSDYADRYAAHFANRWRAVLLAQANPQLGVAGARLEGWLTKQFKANVPYDQLVRSLLTDPDANEYFTAYEGKAENVAGATARALLGIRLECAQCHADRSGGTWTREQFWEYAAFFSRMPVPRVEGIRLQNTVETTDAAPRIKLPESDKYITAKYLDGAELAWKKGSDPRAVLGEWVTKADNQWFARAAVNRVWHHFFGVGLVDPVDGFGTTDNAPSHPELLDELTREFIAHKFDLKFMMRVVVGTKAYQRTSQQTHTSQADPRAFARIQVRALSAEQLFDSLVEATGYQPPAENTSSYPIGPVTSPRATFLGKFQSHPDQPLSTSTSIQQALFLMNGQLTATAGGLESGRNLTTVTSGKGEIADKVGDLFLLVLSRKPTETETKRFTKFITDATDRTEAFADVFWVLLNSTEFAVNH